jgi:hypothetical protein
MSIDIRLEDPSKLGPDGDPGATDAPDRFAFDYGVDEPGDDEPLHPLNWNLLTGEEAESEWLDLNAWVHWLRTTYGLPPTVIPPYWHRHDELVWELSALHLHWLNSYDSEGTPAGPFAWHRDFAEARNRLRDWVSTCGTRLDRDRPTRRTAWPGEITTPQSSESVIEDREADFVQFVMEDVQARRRIEDRVRAAL